MTIYELTEEMQRLFDLAEDGEVDAQIFADTLEGVEYEFEDKAEQYAVVTKSLQGQADMLKAERDRLSAKIAQLEGNAERCKRTLESAMIATGHRKFKTRLYSFGIQKNAPSLSDVDESKVPKEFWVQHAPTIDRRALLAAVKEDPEKYKDIATLKQTESIRIR